MRMIRRTVTAVLAGCLGTLGSVSAQAEVADWREYLQSEAAHQQVAAVDREYALGINRFDLDSHTEILGWQISDSFYFGRQDGVDSGLTLVWQQRANQVSLSKDGLRLTRRF